MRKTIIENALRTAIRKGKKDIVDVAALIDAALDLADDAAPAPAAVPSPNVGQLAAMEQAPAPSILLPSRDEIAAVQAQRLGEFNLPAKIPAATVESSLVIPQAVDVGDVNNVPDYVVSKGERIYWTLPELQAFVEHYSPTELSVKIVGVKDAIVFGRRVGNVIGPPDAPGMAYVSIAYTNQAVKMRIAENAGDISHPPMEKFYVTIPRNEMDVPAAVLRLQEAIKVVYGNTTPRPVPVPVPPSNRFSQMMHFRNHRLEEGDEV